MPDWTALRKSLLPEKSETILPPTIKLPILPKALLDFRRRAEDPEANPVALSRIISTDSGLSSELLRHVNSCKTGMRHKVTSVQQALVTLGIRSTLLYLTTSGVKQAMRSTSSKMINFQNFWNTNLERSIFARELAKVLKVDTDLAFTAGMLQDFLLPVLTNQLVDDYLEFTENRSEYSNLTAFEQQRFGWNHAEAAAQVMYAWNFPDELICCVAFHHKGSEILDDQQLRNTSAAAVAISSLIPDALRQEASGMDQLMKLDQEWEKLNLMKLAESVDLEFKAIASDVKNHFSLLRVYQKALDRLEAQAQASATEA